MLKYKIPQIVTLTQYLFYRKSKGDKIKKEQRLAPTFVNLKSNTMKNTLQRYGLFGK